MDAARYARIKALLHEAAALPSDAREALLRRAALDDPSLVREVRSLLDAAPVATRAVVPAELRRATGPADLASGTQLGRYRIRSELGRGGMGVVYEADDAATGRIVAVKVMLPHLLAIPSVRERFAREARLGALVADANVVRTLDVGEETVDGRPLSFLVMERVHGKTLRRLLETMGTVPEALLREIAVQAARGLAALHAVGVVHRDVKPENVLLADDRRVRIMDLGVARVSGSSGALTEEGQFVGSLRYASPEQCTGATVGAAADLYSLGVVLSELATGRPPFEGDDVAALLRAHAEIRPAPVSERAPGVSDFLSDVVATLLEKEPSKRFRSAGELERVLVEAEGGGWWLTRRRTRGARRPARDERREAIPLVGRDAELGAIATAWRAACGGEGRTVLVVGDTGTGKSRVLREALGAIAREEARLLASDAGPAGDSSPLRAAVAGLLGSDAPSDVAARLGIEPSLAASFVGWLRGHARADATDPIPPAIAEGLFARFLATCAVDAPIVLAVDDAHLADAESRRILLAVARAIPTSRVLLLLGADRTLDAGFDAAIGALPSSARIPLAPLSIEAVEALASRWTGSDTLGVRIARALAPRVEGVPRFLLETLEELARRGHLVRDANGVAREARPLEAFEVPAAVRDLLRSRLGALSLEERSVLDAAAVAGFEFDPRLVVAVRGVPTLDGLEVLGRLERRHGLVHSEARVVRFASRLLHEVVYGELVPALRGELHARFADAIEAAPPPGSTRGDVAVRVVGHRLRSADPARAIPSVVDAMAELEGTGRPEAAVDVARRALAVPSLAPALRVDVLYRLAMNAMTLSRNDDVRAAIDEAVECARREGLDAEMPRLRLLEAQQLLRTGEYEPCLATATELLDHGLHGPGIGRARALMIRGQALWCLGRLEEARDCHETARREAVRDGNEQGEAVACTNVAAALNELGLLDEAETRLRRAIEIRDHQGFRSADVACLNLANVLLDLGRRREALDLYVRSAESNRAVGAREGEEIARLNTGFLKTQIGDFEGAADALRRAVDGCREIGSRRALGYALHGLAMLEALRGRTREAMALYEETIALRRALANRHALADALIDCAGLDVTEGRPEAARARLDEAHGIGREIGDPNLVALAALHAARLPDGDVAAARRAFDAGRARLRADRLLEAYAILLTIDPRREDAEAAVAELARILPGTPPELRAAMIERVTHVRRIVESATKLGVPVPRLRA